MKKLSTVVFILILTITSLAQTVTGKLVDHEHKALNGIMLLKLYSSTKVYFTTSNTDGTFIFNNVTDVETEEELPTGYEISSNYPNPFNPHTRVNITLPIAGNVRVDVYNVLGQQVINTINKYFGAGISSIDIELNGLPNGIYLAKFNIDERYSIIRKLMLLYGSNHLSTSVATNSFSFHSGSGINKTSLATKLDSLVATSTIIGKKIFTNLPIYNGGSLNLGSLKIERYCAGTPTVTYAGKTYNTVQIGSQCWLKENLDIGTMILGNQNPSDNNLIEKYCYDNKSENCDKYGGLYQWNEAMAYSSTPGTKGICPDGWHIPTQDEFQKLSSSVSDNSNALKAIGQGTGYGAGTNESGFSGLFAGYKEYSIFLFLGHEARFCSSAGVSMHFGSGTGIGFSGSTKADNMSVRCVKD